MNRDNPNVYLGGGVLLTVVALLAWWGGYITNGYTVIGMTVAATLGLFFFALNTRDNKWLSGVVVALFVLYLSPFPYYFFTTNFPDLLGETGAVADLKKQKEMFLAEALREEKIVAQELTRCNQIMLANQKPFLEGPTGLEQVAKKKAGGGWSQELYEQWHAHNIAAIREVHEQRRKCGERAKMLSLSAKSTPSASSTGISLAAKIFTFAIGAILLIGWSTSRMSASTSLVYLVILVGAWIVFWGGSWAVGLNLNWLPEPVAQWLRAHAAIIVTVLIGYVALILLWQTKVGEFIVKPLLGTAVAATTLLFVYWIIWGGGWRLGLSLLPKM